MSFRERLIQIHACRGVTWVLLKKFLDFDPTLKRVITLRKDELERYFSMKPKQLLTFIDDLKNNENIVEHYRNNDIHVVTIFDSDYPNLLKEIYDPPWVLYCKGDVSLLSNKRKLSVIGTRDPSRNGLLSLEKIVLPLIHDNWVIVSGLAVGIDGRAHTLSIMNNGKTIAVLGSGFNHIYPHCHRNLASDIASKQLLISEFSPNTPPTKWNFPLRNRIISGLSRGTLVVEARKKSGSLITADLALQQGREVFAVPGSILDDRSEGTHWLIQQGAMLTKCSDDVLNEL
ncbi:DNA-protecting protein DprA [Anaerobacillus alkaliphilus]|uniref:DNA-protecting protein DprA n=1 Tax=Anaerobacillus alkaliphilus TaxID=1548597 RepID=A0A4Q0VRI8_9BACI|nr:DNA-processing protein DprA [Anaerobacillus alkaliphilus]RXI98020.1 DNA-protecting protein DprA [Anaerobacillus alkaliphilus]